MFLLAASYGVTVYADLDDGVRAPLAAVVAAAAVIAANERSEHSKVTELGLQSMQSIACFGAGWFWLRDATGGNPDRLVVAVAIAIAVVVIGASIRNIFPLAKPGRLLSKMRTFRFGGRH